MPKKVKVFLDVPMIDNAIVQALGGRFDGKRRQWFVPAGVLTEPFAQWIPPPPKLVWDETLGVHVEVFEPRLRERHKTTWGMRTTHTKTDPSAFSFVRSGIVRRDSMRKDEEVK